MNRHEPDAVSLAFGALFLAIVTWWLVLRSIHVDLPAAGWYLSGGLVLLGLVGLFAAVRPRRSSLK
jgi:hypothetical protein